MCPVCSKFVSTDEMDLHIVMCLTKPRVTYNGKTAYFTPLPLDCYPLLNGCEGEGLSVCGQTRRCLGCLWVNWQANLLQHGCCQTVSEWAAWGLAVTIPLLLPISD
jgi:hypothetical protein